MKVIVIETGTRETLEDSYALRLIEQGRALPVAEEAAPKKKKAVVADGA